MISFAIRSDKKELLDSLEIPFRDIVRNMEELDYINRYLGGHDVTLCGLSRVLNYYTPSKGQITVVEIGCGGGNNLYAIKEWSQKNNRQIELTGIDINPECINYAKQQQRNLGINFITSDYKNVVFQKQPDIIFSSLFCHHFTDEELISMLKWMKINTRFGFFINDLHRHPLAYFSIKWLTSFFSKSYLVKNDAPLSVLRGFREEDWKQLFTKAGIDHYTHKWKWAFRWLITCNTNGGW